MADELSAIAGGGAARESIRARERPARVASLARTEPTSVMPAPVDDTQSGSVAKALSGPSRPRRLGAWIFAVLGAGGVLVTIAFLWSARTRPMPAADPDPTAGTSSAATVEAPVAPRPELSESVVNAPPASAEPAPSVSRRSTAPIRSTSRKAPRPHTEEKSAPATDPKFGLPVGGSK
jgi:hypothetical protein